MTRPFSVVIAALEVAFGISFLLSLGFWGEHWSILRGPDRTMGPLVRYLRGFSRSAPSGIRQSSRKLQIGPAVDFLQSDETELGDARGRYLAAVLPRLAFNTVNEEGELPRVELPLVGRAVEAAEQLVPIERLAVSVALDDLQALRDRPLVGGEAMAAGRAFTAPANHPIRDAAGLEGLRGGVAAGTV